MRTIAVIAYTLALAVVAGSASAQIKNRLDPEDYDYILADGVTTKEITYYSEGVACWGKIFFPKGFAESDSRPGIVLAHGWTGTHASLEQYANKFADSGLIAMAIDYRGWGNSNGFITLVESVKTDDQKHQQKNMELQPREQPIAPAEPRLRQERLVRS